MCLISDQATPNLIPLMDPALAPKKLAMVTSEKMRQRADWLAEVAKPMGIRAEIIAINDPWNLEEITDRLLSWLAAQQDESGVALNVTGGTKPMAMAAQQAFTVAERPVFYVNQSTDEVLWLIPPRPARKILARLKLGPYLHAHGWQVLSNSRAPSPSYQVDQLAKQLAGQVSNLEPSLAKLNCYASQCQEEKTLSVELPDRDWRDPGFITLIEKFSDAGACEIKGRLLHFPTEEMRFFCNGGWLEQYVYKTVLSLKSEKVQDVALNLQVRSLNNHQPGLAGSNELDVAFLANNRLHIIECKTRRFQQQHVAAETVYKLDSLTHMGGLRTKGALVSYRPLSGSDVQRAKDLQIKTFIGRQIQQLEGALQQWIAS